MVGADLPICNIQHHYLVSGPIPEFIERDEEIPVMRDPYSSAYLRQEQKSGLIGIYEHDNLAEAWPPRGLPDWESDSELFDDDLDPPDAMAGARDGAYAGHRKCRPQTYRQRRHSPFRGRPAPVWVPWQG